MVKLPVDPNPEGYCMCGCGKRTNLHLVRFSIFGIETLNLLIHYKFAKGHYNNRKPDNSAFDPNPSGLCMCGCGRKTAVVLETCRNVNGEKIFSGNHRRWVKGHHQRKPLEYKIDPSTGCWVWQRAKNKGNGYPTMRDPEAGKNTYAHLYIYKKLKGPIPPGLELDHLCRNIECVNPAHLEPVTPAVNTRRRPITKLTEAMAAEARSLRKAGMFVKTIAERFGVSRTTIGSLLQGRTWKPSPGPVPAERSANDAAA